MSSICGIIAPMASVGCREELVNLSRSVKDKKIYENFNKNDVYIGLCSQRNKNDAESIIYKGVRYSYSFCGELYNKAVLAEKIKAELGYSPIEELNDGIIAVWCYILWGGFSPKMLKGKFAFAIYSEGIFATSGHTPRVFIAKDRFGFIPIYYYQNPHGVIYFSSDIHSMLKIKGMRRDVSFSGLWQIFYLEGMTLPPKTIFEGIEQLEAGSCAYIDCRGKSKILKKCYDNPRLYKISPEVTLDGIIENSFCEKGIKKSDSTFEFTFPADSVDTLNESLKATLLPINPTFYASISRLDRGKTHISSIGRELIFSQNIPCMRGFFSWISDPYKNIDLLNSKRLRLYDGFDFINSERLRAIDSESDKYELDSLYRFYIPMVLCGVEKISENLGVSVKYPYCDEDIVGYLYTKNQLPDSLKPTFCHQNKQKSAKKSEFEAHIIDYLENTLSNSESVLNYVVDKEKFRLCISRGEFHESLILLYSLHFLFEEFNLNLNIKA